MKITATNAKTGILKHSRHRFLQLSPCTLGQDNLSDQNTFVSLLNTLERDSRIAQKQQRINLGNSNFAILFECAELKYMSLSIAVMALSGQIDSSKAMKTYYNNDM